MSADRIERQIVIDAPVDIVWRVVTEPDQIVQWFSDVAEIDLRPGGEGTLTFNVRATHQPVVVPIQVESIDPPHRFSFRWPRPIDDVARSGNSTLVEFILHPEGDTTRLRVVESGLLEMEWTQDEQAKYVEDHGHGWDVHVTRLRDYVGQQALPSR